MAQNYVLLETIVLNQSTATVVFDNIPQTGYTDLKMVASTRLNVNDVNVSLYFNADSTASNYANRRLFGDGSTVSSDASTATRIAYAGGGANTTASTYGNTDVYFPNYSVAGIKKSYYNYNATENNGATAYTTMGAMLWQGTDAINTITMFTNTSGTFDAGSTFSLYGLAALNTTPVTGPFASGGNIVANDGTYWYHAFLTSGTFTAQKDLSCDYLVVAGGGGGFRAYLGGGGAGGLRSTVGTTGGGGSLESPISLKAGIYPVTVGAGGTEGGRGNNSIFSTITSTGGGGALDGVKDGGSGSGGGAQTISPTPGAGTTGQGFAGANGSNTNGASAGGGGAGAVGNQGSGSVGGAGGAGVQILAFSTPTNTGVSTGRYAGGGGGGGDTGSSGGAGGAGGGGAGGNPSTAAGSGTPNTGGGGGSTYTGGSYGSGGSGIVIVRYPMAS
jgi:hypothetical protein